MRCAAALVVIDAVLAGSVLLASGAATPAEILSPGPEVVGAREFTLQDLRLPYERPETLHVAVNLGDAAHEFVLRRHSLRAPDFVLRAYRSDGSYEELLPALPGTYRGTIAGQPDTEVVAGLGSHGLSAHVFVAGEHRWSVRPLAVLDGEYGREDHAVFRAEDAIKDPGGCSTCDDLESAPEERWTPVEFPNVTRTFSPAGGQYRTQIAFDADYEYYLLKGSSVSACLDAVETILNNIDFFYARDLMVTYELTNLVVRTSQFYSPTSGGDLLDLFRSEWNSNQAHIARDVAHLMTDKSTDLLGSIGRAWVMVPGALNRGVVCTNHAYAWSKDFFDTVAHELGHNWSAGHCDYGTLTCNIMCGKCLSIEPPWMDLMIAYRDSQAWCLDDVGAYPDPLPPYAHDDGLQVPAPELPGLGPVVFDVLGNDHDANLDELAIDAYDTKSERGGTVTLSEGSGPEGRDELVYESLPGVFTGKDRFTYGVRDRTGLQAVGEVTIDAQSRGVVAYWPLDEGQGLAAQDHSNRCRHGELKGGAAWTAGQIGGALEFDGIDAMVESPPLNLYRDELTISAWIRRTGDQYIFSPIVLCRDEDTFAGLIFGAANELRYHWNDDPAASGWDSGLIVPDETWVFVALVVKPSHAMIYLSDGAMLQSATNVTSHGLEEFNGDVVLGADPEHTWRRYVGRMDDVRIYDYALDEAEIEALARWGGRAVGPNPLNGGPFVPSVSELSWQPSPLAEGHDLYVGLDYLSVREATRNAPEYRGSTTDTRWTLEEPPGPGEARFWRVDEIVGAVTVRGDVWEFDGVRSYGHWKFDEAPGSPTAINSDGDLHGTYHGAGVLGWPGAFPTSGTAIRLDGTSAYIEVPPLNLDVSEATFMGWVWMEQLQGWVGPIVTTHEGAPWTHAEMNIKNGDELRYNWYSSKYTWNPGFTLPLSEWVFCALVVRYDHAMLYLGTQGDLSSATNWDKNMHLPISFVDSLRLGRDSQYGQFLSGALDEVRVYRGVLSDRDIRRYYDQALLVGQASDPTPADQSLSVPLDTDLAWTAGAGAPRPHLYFGTVDPPPYVGRPIGAAYDPGPLAEGTTYFWRVDATNSYGTTTGETWSFTTSSVGVPAGAIPNGNEVPGSPLVLDRLSAVELLLAWDDSCLPLDVDYAVYEGVLGDFTSHDRKTCSSGGLTSVTIQPETGDRYYLVVPLSSTREGGYGTDSEGTPRLQGSSPCRVQEFGGC